MPEYGNIDNAIAGLKYGFTSRVKSRRCAEENGIPYGYPVFGYVGNDRDVFLFHNNVATIVWDADFVSGNDIDITVDGTAVTTVTFATSHAATIEAVRAQIEADIAGATAVLTDSGGDNRTIQITIEDDGNRAVTEAVTGGGSQASGTITYSSSMVFSGFSLFTQQEYAPKEKLDGTSIDSGKAYYEYKEAVNVMIDGWIYVVTADAVDSKNAVYAVATGANQGKCTDTATDNIALSGATFDETVAAAGIARVRVNK